MHPLIPPKIYETLKIGKHLIGGKSFFSHHGNRSYILLQMRLCFVCFYVVFQFSSFFMGKKTIKRKKNGNHILIGINCGDLL